ncbi:MAG: radical SAM protein [Candidatus Omnitrophota bacterium]
MAIKSKKSDDFYRDLYRLANNKRFPLKVLFEITYKCNFNCVHCYNVKNNKRKEIKTDEVKQILKQLARAGCFHVGFTGGEPLLREDIFEILEFTKSLGLRITILTNGYLIDKKTADKISKLGVNLNKVDISFLGANKETFENITRKPGSFAKVKNAIKLLRSRNVEVMIKPTLMKQNKDEFLRIKKMAEKFGCMYKFSPTLNAGSDGSKGPLKYRLSPEEVIKTLESFSLISDKNNRAGEIKRIKGKKRVFRCGSGCTEASLNPYGELKLCPEINEPAFDILSRSLEAAWKDLKKFVKDLEKTDYVCKNCYLSAFCNTCPARMFVEGGSLKICNQYDKELAIIKAKKSGHWDKLKSKVKL